MNWIYGCNVHNIFNILCERQNKFCILYKIDVNLVAITMNGNNNNPTQPT